jgi:hypothetical protein
MQQEARISWWRAGWLVPQILLLATLARLLQRFFVLPRLVSLFDAAPRRMATASEVERLCHLTQALLRRLFRQAYCLPQSLVLFHLLRRRGQAVRLHCGVMKQQGQPSGHAWITLGGRPLAEQVDPALVYKTFYHYPA